MLTLTNHILIKWTPHHCIAPSTFSQNLPCLYNSPYFLYLCCVFLLSFYSFSFYHCLIIHLSFFSSWLLTAQIPSLCPSAPGHPHPSTLPGPWWSLGPVWPPSIITFSLHLYIQVIFPSKSVLLGY